MDVQHWQVKLCMQLQGWRQEETEMGVGLASGAAFLVVIIKEADPDGLSALASH